MIDFTVPTPEAIAAAQKDAIARADAIVAEVVALPPGSHTFANTLGRLEDVADIIEKANGRYGFMGYVAADEKVRNAADGLREALEKYAIELGFREDLYRAVLAFAETAEAKSLQGEQRRLLDWTLRDYRRDGLSLPPEQRARVQELKQRLVELDVIFQRNIATWEDAIIVSESELQGLPPSYISGLQAVESHGEPLYKVSLDYPEMYPFLDNAEAEEPRRDLMVRNYRKGGEENIKVLEEAIAVRDELAHLLGYDSWAAYGIEIYMAKTPAAVDSFLTDLSAKVTPKRDADMAGLLAAKRAHTGNPDAKLELWDWRFYHNYLLKTEYKVDDFEVANYFPLDAVLEGLFHTMQTLLGVRFEPVEPANAWHPDVKLFQIFESGVGEGGPGRTPVSDQSGVSPTPAEPVAHFYMDLFPRDNKFGHAAAFTLVDGRRLPDGSYQAPVSAIVANFTKPSAETPSLLRHTEVVTLFHEFGHILHQTLTSADYVRFSGSRTERDFVEAPSQMLEHWVWQPEVLASFSRHYQTGEPLPKDLLDSMVAAKNLDSGVMAMRQLYFATLDMAYHAAGSRKDTTALAHELHPISGFEAPEKTYWQAGFGHLFGYDAGYYSYKWSEVFADDMYTRFEAAGPFNTELGLEYRRTVLARGGSVDGDVLVRDFLGREPNSDAFLKNMGL